MGDMADYYLEQDWYDYWDGDTPPQELTWTTKEGEKIPVSEMKLSHIFNCIKLLKRRKEDINFWIACFEDELKLRE